MGLVYPRLLLLALRSFFAALSLVSPRAAGRVALRLFCTPRRHHQPGWERQIAAAGRRFRAGSRLAARTFGAGPLVLLLHGWEGRGLQLGRFVDPLVRAGFRVVAIDLPAHGESPGARTDLIECTEALRKVGRDLGPLAAVVAHSFGGAVTTLALERGLDAGAVVLIASPSSIDDVVRRFGELTGLRGAGMRAFRDAIERQTAVRLADVEIFERVARLRVPALIVHDHDDREVPFHDAERLAARWPNATLLPTKGAGHRRILKDEEVIRRAVQFLVTVSHEATTIAKIGHEDTTVTKVGHEDTTISHEDTKITKISHEDTKLTKIGHKDTKLTKIGHEDTTGTTIGHEDTTVTQS